MTEKMTIGRAEFVTLPEFGLDAVSARVDTGAATSSIHCHDVEEFRRDGARWIRFTLLDEAHPEWTGTPLETYQYKSRRVRSSFGDEQRRYVITTTVVVRGLEIETDLTLADREAMSYPLLLGRRLLAGNFVVDVEHTGIEGAD